MPLFIWVYYIAGTAFLAGMIHQCRPKTIQNRLVSPARYDAVFLGSLLFVLAFMRAPSVFYNEELNVDESQTIASAITLLSDPVYGRSVDGTTLGPLNSYLLLLPHALGLPLDYTSARLVALLLLAGSIILFYISLLRIVSPTASRISTVLIAVFFSWTTHKDFLHFSSELPSLLILTACFYITLRLLQSAKVSVAALFWVGLLAGLTPYSKLQALPIVGMTLLTLTLYLVRRYRVNAMPFLLIAGVGFLVPSLIVFGLAFYFNVSGYFIDYYFVGNLVTYEQIYANVPLVHQHFIYKLLRFPLFLMHHVDFLFFLVFTCLAAVVGAISSRKRPVLQPKSIPSLHWPIVLVLLTTGGAIWAVITPGTEFGHHLVLLVFPLSWVTGLALQAIINRLPNHYACSNRIANSFSVALISLVFAANLVHAYGYRLVSQLTNRPTAEQYSELVPLSNQAHWLHPMNPCLFSFPAKKHMTLSPVARLVDKYAVHSDQMAVWGWNCRYYVETQLAQGVSEGQTQRSVVPNQMQARYLNRYAQELRQNKPVIFIDAVGRRNGFLNKTSQQHQFFRQIADIIRKRYRLIKTVEDVRIYVRRDHLILRQ